MAIRSRKMRVVAAGARSLALRESLIDRLAEIDNALKNVKTAEERERLLELKRRLVARIASLPAERVFGRGPAGGSPPGVNFGKERTKAAKPVPPKKTAKKSAHTGARRKAGVAAKAVKVSKQAIPIGLSTARKEGKGIRLRMKRLAKREISPHPLPGGIVKPPARGVTSGRIKKKAVKPLPRTRKKKKKGGLLEFHYFSNSLVMPTSEALESLTTALPGPADISASLPISNAAASAPITAPDISPPTLIRRTPHMDVDQPLPLKAGATFNISVYVDQEAAHGGEESEDVAVPAGANVDVHLVASDHFTIGGPSTVMMEVGDAPRSDAPPFTVTVKAAGDLRTDVPPSLIALFFYQGRPSGKVSRAVSIAGVAAPPPAAVDAAKPQLEARAGISADLIVTITAAEINDGRQFFCTVATPRFDKYKTATTRPWNLPGSAEDIVLSFMEQFTASGNSDAALTAGLRGAGRLLYDGAPDIFKDALWAMVDANQAPAQIALVTAEPFIPWELMIPYRRRTGQAAQYLAPQGPKALGASFSIGRWPTEDGISPNQSIPLVDSYVIAPSYNPPLANARAEAAFVVENFAGEIITPANFEQIQRKLGTQGRSLVHLVCHGKDQDTAIEAMRDDQRRTRARAQTIVLDDNKTLDSTQILGMEGLETVFETKRPFVFLNACEIGRAIPALVGLGGFASSFIDLGASGVVAALWSVEDAIASEVAKSFYQRLKNEPNTPFAEILRDLRSKAYGPGAKDTYAAYCLYGDPAARRASAS